MDDKTYICEIPKNDASNQYYSEKSKTRQQTEQTLIRRLIMSRLDWIHAVCASWVSDCENVSIPISDVYFYTILIAKKEAYGQLVAHLTCYDTRAPLSGAIYARGAFSVEGNTTLLELIQWLKSPLCSSTDNQKWIFNTKGQHSVKTKSRIIVLCTSSDGAGYLYKI